MLDTMAARSTMASTIPVVDVLEGERVLLVVAALSGNTNATKFAVGSFSAGAAKGSDITVVAVDAARIMASISAGDALHTAILLLGVSGTNRLAIVSAAWVASRLGMSCRATKPGYVLRSRILAATNVSHDAWLIVDDVVRGNTATNAFAPYKRFSTSFS